MLLVDVNTRIVQFRKDLLAYDDTELIQRCFEHDLAPACIRSGLYFELRKAVATRFDLHPTDVLMVGSARLGFTIKSSEPYRLFGDRSDIDLAIISPRLFEDFWKAVLLYKEDVKYWPKEEGFKKYLLRGWIRPDLLPPADAFKKAADWWEFFRELTYSGRFGPYKISGSLYYSKFFFELYQSACIRACKKKEAGEVS